MYNWLTNSKTIFDELLHVPLCNVIMDYTSLRLDSGQLKPTMFLKLLASTNTYIDVVY